MIPNLSGAPAPTGKTCPFSTGPVIPPLPPQATQTIEIAGRQQTVQQVSVQLVNAPCVRTCQFFDGDSEGCILADAARVLRSGQQEASEALRALAEPEGEGE